MDYNELISIAVNAMKSAYAPYSEFTVGAALLSEDGTVYTGCNIENASYGATSCAERTAFYEAVKSGKRKFTAICIVGGKNGIIKDYCFPCGICRQVMAEFCKSDFRIVLFNGRENKIFELGSLLPFGFSGEVL